MSYSHKNNLKQERKEKPIKKEARANTIYLAPASYLFLYKILEENSNNLCYTRIYRRSTGTCRIVQIFCNITNELNMTV